MVNDFSQRYFSIQNNFQMGKLFRVPTIFHLYPFTNKIYKLLGRLLNLMTILIFKKSMRARDSNNARTFAYLLTRHATRVTTE